MSITKTAYRSEGPAPECVSIALWDNPARSRLGFHPIHYRRLPFWAWGLTWNFIQHLILWKYRLKMRTFVELERIIWRTSKVFVFGNPYSTVLAIKPAATSRSRRTLAPSEAMGGVAETDASPAN